MLLLGEILLEQGPYFAGMFLHRRICIYGTNITFNSVIQNAVCQTFNHLIRSPTVFFFFFATIDMFGNHCTCMFLPRIARFIVGFTWKVYIPPILVEIVQCSSGMPCQDTVIFIIQSKNKNDVVYHLSRFPRK